MNNANNATMDALATVNSVFGTISPDIFMRAGDSLFDGITADDLALPEKIIFLKDEIVQATVLDVSENVRIGMIKLEVKVLSGDHGSKLFEMIFFRPKVVDGKMNATSKRKWVDFLLAFWTKDQVLKNQVDMTSPIGKRIEFRAGEAKEWKGKTMQDFYNIKIVG